MGSYRRSFLKMAAISGGAAAILQLESSCVETEKKNSSPDYQALDKVLQLPVLKRGLFPSPIIIEKIELLQDRKNLKASWSDKSSLGFRNGRYNRPRLYQFE